MKRTLSILSLALTLSVACGQSIITSPQDDSLLLHKFLSNTAPIRDSLIRFEFTKQRLLALQFDYSLLKHYSTELTTRNTELLNHNSQLVTHNSQLVTHNSQLKTKLRNSRIEKWTWRLTAATIIYFRLRPYI